MGKEGLKIGRMDFLTILVIVVSGLILLLSGIVKIGYVLSPI
ncbi:hypothetical protein [Methanobacterium ferruginis]|nr:hypothetical protein [Methanobacterium ferruginis]